MKIDITRSTIEGRDAQVSKELRTVGGRLEEALSQTYEVTEMVGGYTGRSISCKI